MTGTPPHRVAERNLSYGVVLMVAVAAVSSIPVVPSSGSVSARAVDSPAAGSIRPQVQELARLVNRHRRAKGCRPLIWDERLAAVAQRHSEDMARRRFFAHTNPDGKSPFDRLRRAGISYRVAAENIGEGDLSPREMLNGWLASRGHRANLENCSYTHHGIGLYGKHWTHLLVRPESP